MVGTELVGLWLVQAAVLLLVVFIARTGWRAHRLTGARTLLAFSAGFFALAAAQVAAMVMEGLSATASVISTTRLDAFDFLFWTYYAGLVGGFILLLLSVGRRHFQPAAALAPLLLVAGPLGQLTGLVLLFLLVLNLGLNHIEYSRTGSLQTALGFFFLLVGQFLFLFGYEPLSPRNFVGELATLVGVALLYWTARKSFGGPR